MDRPSRSNAATTDDKLKKIGLVESEHISLDVPAAAMSAERPLAVSYLSTPAYHSPLRHHRRTSSRNRAVKETLNAKSHYGSSSDDNGPSIHRINQYFLGQEIGRGSFGCVVLAEDQYGNEFAIKEFSKSRLRKRAQSELLRRPHGRKRGSTGWGTSSGGVIASMRGQMSPNRTESDTNNAFDLIKSEIAVMKKLDHPNLVSLIEVLDDPHEDSLYMVLEMCKKGVVMKIGLGDKKDPYDEETCRYWFRDLLLGLEYLHAQGIIHRDLKPDNCLITQDDVLKIVDFGVSEMFDKSSDMSTTKSSGSPAFMPPELCVAKHGSVSGRAVDIWSMGVTLYCLRYGTIPFERSNMLDLYEAIRNDELQLEGETNEDFRDLMHKLLEKDPGKRIKMKDIRVHPWVTKNGEDPLLSEEENCNHIVDEPTEAEMNAAITGNMGRLLAVAKAVKRFKRLLARKRPEIMDGILGNSSRFVAPPASLEEEHRNYRQSRSQDTYDRRPLETALAVEGVHHKLQVDDKESVSGKAIQPKIDHHHGSPTSPQPTDSGHQRSLQSPGVLSRTSTRTSSAHDQASHPGSRNFSPDDTGRGHAHDPLLDTLFLNIGAGPSSPTTKQHQTESVVCESPSAVEDNIYEKAYEQELERIAAQKGKSATMYLSRRVDHRHEFREREGVVDNTRSATVGGLSGGLADLVRKAKSKAEEDANKKEGEASSSEHTTSHDD